MGNSNHDMRDFLYEKVVTAAAGRTSCPGTSHKPPRKVNPDNLSGSVQEMAGIVTSCRKFDTFGDWYLIRNPGVVWRIFVGKSQKDPDALYYDVKR
jgi:hypothetical protein